MGKYFLCFIFSFFGSVWDGIFRLYLFNLYQIFALCCEVCTAFFCISAVVSILCDM